MPTPLTFPGVYIEEIKSGVRTITGVATSIAAFVGGAESGPLNDPTTMDSFGDYEREFGGLSLNHSMGFAVRDFFLHGGSQAIVVRVAEGTAARAAIVVPSGGTTPHDTLALVAASEGAWGNDLKVIVDLNSKDPAKYFNLTLFVGADLKTATQVEKFLNLAIVDSDPRYAPRVLKQNSALVRVDRTTAGDWIVPAGLPKVTTTPIPATAASGNDGGALAAAQFTGSQADKTGIFALDKADIFNLLCIPPYLAAGDVDQPVIDAAAQYCHDRRAMLLVDPPSTWTKPKDAIDHVDTVLPRSSNAALFFPRLIEANPLRENQLEQFVPSGAVAGIFARTDATRGVWKAPAGTDATFVGVPQLSVHLTDAENGHLNPLAVNCLRSFPVIGRVVWGSRTGNGADILSDDYKYIPVRRMALFIEESLFRGTKWVVFEPNDEPLWAQIRLNVGAFMNNLFRQGAFQGTTPRDAYFVKCDKETTTQNNINLGIVNIVVGFAPLKPAEFVVIKLQQIAGQIDV